MDLFFRKALNSKNILFFILLILFIIFISSIKDIAILFFASFVIACSLNPLVDKLEKKNIKRSLGSAIVLSMMILISGLFFLPLLSMAIIQIKNLILYLPDLIDNTKEFITAAPFIDKSALLNMDLGALFSSFSGFTSNFVNESINISKDVATALIYAFAACIIVYYFLADKNTIKDTYLSLFPKTMKPRAKEIINSIAQKVGGYVTAQIVTIFSVGLIMTIGLLILKVDYAILLGLITAILDLIPIVGPTIALVITLLVALKTGPITLSLILLVFIFAQWAENNFVRPYVFSKFLDLHPLLIYFAIFATAHYLGVVGVIFAPAIAATVCVLIEELYIKSVN